MVWLHPKPMKTFYLPKELRLALKKIWGTPIFGNEEEVEEKYKKFIQEKAFKKIITVGDCCSLTLFSHIKIFDGRIKRKKVKKVLPFSLSCSNPPGTIQKEVWPIIQRALLENKNVFIEGEEDLLVIPTVLLAKEGSMVVYGFPEKGICLIEVSSETKKIFKEILNKFHSK